MQELKKKKILILGGSILACDMVEAAQKLGAYTIVTNYDKKSEAKYIADEAVLISTAEIEKLIVFCRDNSVDGVFTSSDFSYPIAQIICERMGYPFTIDSKKLQLVTKKNLAKCLFLKHNISVPAEYKIRKDHFTDDINVLKYPILMKPVDCSGQEGIFICRNKTEAIQGYEFALHSSRSKEVVVEDYLYGDYIVVCFTVQNGYVSLSAMADKSVLIEEEADGFVKLPTAYFLPSKYLKRFYNNYFNKFRNLIRDLNMTNGSYSAEAIVVDDQFYFFEMQTRLGGMKHHEFVKAENELDILEMHIRFAIDGRFDGYSLKELDNPYFNNHYCMLHLILKPGTIKSIQGFDKIEHLSEILKIYQLHNIGDKIEPTGTLKQVFAKILLKAQTINRLNEIILIIKKSIKVIDASGVNQLMEGLLIRKNAL